MNAGPAIAKRSKPNVDPSTMVAIGEIIYATNAIESLNGAIRAARAFLERIGVAP